MVLFVNCYVVLQNTIKLPEILERYFRTFVGFMLVWFCRFPLPLGVWEGLRFVIVALPGLFSYPFFTLSVVFHLTIL